MYGFFFFLENLVCGSILNTARTETDKLKLKLTVCVNEANKLKAQVTKDLNTGTDRTAILNDITGILSDLDMHKKLAEKNHYFLRIFDHLYCKYFSFYSLLNMFAKCLG